MRILHVGPVRITGGACGPSQSIRGLARAHAGIGMEVGLITNFPIDGHAAMDGIDGVRYCSSPDKTQRLPWFSNHAWIDRIEKEFGRPDIVNFHSTYIPFNIAMGRLCRKAGWPYVITPRGGMTPVAQKIKPLKKKIANFTCFNSFVHHASAIHALCENEAVQIRRCFDVEQIFSVSNGVDEALFEKSRTITPADIGGPAKSVNLVLGFVGRIDVYIKGLDLLLEALGKLKKRGIRCVYFMIGPFFTEADKQQIETMIRRFELADTVRMVGTKYGDEKWSWFLACDVLVYTSRSEGVPMAVLEAMALGKPCLVTPSTNMAEVVCRGGGWRCELDSGNIADALEAISRRPEDVIAAGRQSQRLLQDEYTWPKVARQLCDHYEQILERSCRSSRR